MIIAAALALGICSAAETAVSPPSAAKPADATTGQSASKPPEKRVRAIGRDDAPTGTRFAKRTCVPVEEFKRRQDKAYEGMVEMQHNATSTNMSR